jgi:hypothetical protein
MTTKLEQSLQAITLYGDLMSDSDQQDLFEIAQRALRKAVKIGKAQIISTPVELTTHYVPGEAPAKTRKAA